MSYILMIVLLIRGGNPTIILIGTGILWAVLGGLGVNGVVNDLIGAQISNNGAALMTILFGAWFAQVLLKTGIVPTIIRTAVELGGDSPKLVVVLIMVVVSFLFTSLFSIGPVIAVGVIVLPVMISIGVKPVIATVAYVISIGIGSLVNVSQYQVLRGLVPFCDVPEEFGSPWTPYAFIAFGIGLLVNIVGVLVAMHLTNSKKKVKSWAVKEDGFDGEEAKFAPAYACIAPFIPVLLVILFKVNIFVAFIIGAIYAIGTTKIMHRKIRVFPMISKTFQCGFSEASGMVMYMICTYVLAAGARAATPIIQESFGRFFPQTTLGLCLLIALGVPLLLYRGPLAIGGAGAAFFATIAAVGAIPSSFIWMMAYTVSGIHYALDPTASCNVWSCSYTKVKPTTFIKMVLPINWIFGICIIATLYFMHG
ncbi:MAG TPA: hypothetical protein IAC62_13625 [Candidatus Pelethocola excrementipullorum]|nr:hypothetical protein [Candidatus Pelethocola excrementipullorum]